MSDVKSNPVSISLKSLLVPSKSVEAEFPGFKDFVVSLAFLTRETLVAIRKKATKTTYKNKVGAVEEVNDELFLSLYVDAAIKGWSGLKFSYLEQLAPVDVAGQDKDSELAYSSENALFLMKSSATFDAWISDTVTELGNFQKDSAKK